MIPFNLFIQAGISGLWNMFLEAVEHVGYPVSIIVTVVVLGVFLFLSVRFLNNDKVKEVL